MTSQILPGIEIAQPLPGQGASTNATGQYTPMFDEQAYLQANPDVAASVATGQFASGLAHYNANGRNEGRQGFYRNQTPIADVIGSQVNNPSLPQGTQVTATPMQEQSDEILQNNTGNRVDSINLPTPRQAAQQTKTDAHTYDATKVAGTQGTSTAAQGTVSAQGQTTAAQGTVGAATLAALDPSQVTGEVDPRALVQNQYKELTNFPAGQVPGWAAGAVREAEQRMAARGLGASTMSGEGVTAAILAAAMPIAQQDAKVFETMTLTNLDKKAQATFLKAGYLAAMDMKNLDFRQQANVQNAQAFLAMDMKNLDNRQQKNVLDFNARVQTLLSDQAAENASKQFNATSKNQVDQFFASLAQDVEKFNAGQANDVNKFNSQLQEQRNEFNARQQIIIDQSNATWRRQINTMNTASENAANATNAANLLGISQYSMSALWQQYRDEASWLFTASQSQESRDLQLALAAMGRQHINDQIDSNNSSALLGAAGSVVSSILRGALF